LNYKPWRWVSSLFYSRAGLEQTQAYRYAQEMMSLNALSEDAREGISAFLQKRSPKWKGR
jgi:enoyl-CoA hydratase/carnithine racemase